MAKVILTIEDQEDGVKLTLESKPPFSMNGESKDTNAQIAGVVAMRAIRNAVIEEESR